MSVKREVLENRIKKHEGLILHPYKDSLDNWTIGYGHKLLEGEYKLYQHGISKDQANMLFAHDLYKCEEEYTLLSEDIKLNCNWYRYGVLVEMIFQLGFHGLLKFKKMLAAIREEDFDKAADEMLDSLWYVQTPNRCRELSEVMRNGN